MINEMGDPLTAFAFLLYAEDSSGTGTTEFFLSLPWWVSGLNLLEVRNGYPPNRSQNFYQSRV